MFFLILISLILVGFIWYGQYKGWDNIGKLYLALGVLSGIIALLHFVSGNFFWGIVWAVLTVLDLWIWRTWRGRTSR